MGLDEGASLMTLNFSKESAQVVMSGVTFERNFRGRFTAVGAGELAATVPFSPTAFALPQTRGDGDTGTASGTQT
jgi:hypothetical protein